MIDYSQPLTTYNWSNNDSGGPLACLHQTDNRPGPATYYISSFFFQELKKAGKYNNKRVKTSIHLK